MWAAWVDNRLYVEGSPATRWGRNITANPQASLHLESGSDVVIVEGRIEDVDDIGDALVARVFAAYAAEYHGDQPRERSFFILVSRVVIVWSRFPADATCWHFAIL